MEPEKPLHITTPLLFSTKLSALVGADVFLKMENVQNSGSYKMRGVGRMCQVAKAKGCHEFVGSSSGNSGMALAVSAKTLGVPATIYVPTTTPDLMVRRLQAEGAAVKVHGSMWSKANEKALEAGKGPGTAFIHPYDHPVVWEGVSSLVDELVTQLEGTKPRCLVLSVGGGGLLCGILHGFRKAGWQDVPVLAMETIGADCFNKSVKAGQLVTIPDVTSIAKSLGACAVTPHLLELLPSFVVVSEVVEDKEAVDACLRFADDHRSLVEPACGATLAAIYSGNLKRFLATDTMKEGPVVAIVCGGNVVTLDMLEAWRKQFGIAKEELDY